MTDALAQWAIQQGGFAVSFLVLWYELRQFRSELARVHSFIMERMR